MSQNSKISQTNMHNNLRSDRQAARRIDRRTLLEGVDGLAAASFVGVRRGRCRISPLSWLP